MAEIVNTNAVIKINSADPTTSIKVDAPTDKGTLKISAINEPAVLQVSSTGTQGTLTLSSVIISDLQIEVGTTTTLPAGSSATVTNSGTNKHAVLNFGIPKGDKGDNAEWGNITGDIEDQEDLQELLGDKQEELVSGSNIKTVNGQSILGSGDLTVQSQTFTYEQGVASNTWTIAHNLNKFPSVTVIDSAGSEVQCQIIYVDENNCTVNMNSSFKGKAYLN